MNILYIISLSSYLCLAGSIILLWFDKISKKINLFLIIIGLILALISKTITFFGILWISFLILLMFGISSLKKIKLLIYQKPIIYLLHCIFIILATLMFFHLLPGFHNLQLLINKKFCSRCAPYNLYLNFDIAIVGYLMLMLWLDKANKKDDWLIIFKTVISTIIPCIIVLIGTSYYLKYICLSPKLPIETLLWSANNLLFVCTTEEAFFRGYIQKNLMDYLHTKKISKWFAIIIASVLFGLRHIKGGSDYVILSGIAGVFYGAAYAKSNCRIEASILTHFGLNAVHFLLFSYPFLLR